MRSPRQAGGIDHLVLASRDLAAAADAYRRLGFQVGARNRHPWGTENHIVQLEGSFLELIALGGGAVARDGEGAYPFAGFLAGYLAKRQGLAMLVLESADADADHARFAAAGIGVGAPPFHFERRGRRPDGTEVTVGFTLAFARSPALHEAGFFVCRQHNPESFWNPAFQVHPNTARMIAGVVLVAPDPGEHAAFLAAFTGSGVTRRGGLVLDTPRGEIEVLAPSDLRQRYGADAGASETQSAAHFAAFRIAVADLGAAAGVLDGNGIGYARAGASIVVPPKEAFGCALVFEAAPGR
jgi:hypothetical protein